MLGDPVLHAKGESPFDDNVPFDDDINNPSTTFPTPFPTPSPWASDDDVNIAKYNLQPAMECVCIVVSDRPPVKRILVVFRVPILNGTDIHCVFLNDCVHNRHIRNAKWGHDAEVMFLFKPNRYYSSI
jgi:hypothetical protein